ncbi:unnamed protein product [Linum tenue]|uniref:Uncharacterized protein n=1 Tax=Linum tenue TaxID=586396 RepID=A0AAV0K2L7_9ROSI|nr:unnamed protein product [Linum tenue]
MAMTRNFGASELKLQCSTGKNLSRSKERIALVRICGFHINLLVNVSKIDGGGTLVFVCSAWRRGRFDWRSRNSICFSVISCKEGLTLALIFDQEFEWRASG